MFLVGELTRLRAKKAGLGKGLLLPVSAAKRGVSMLVLLLVLQLCVVLCGVRYSYCCIHDG